MIHYWKEATAAYSGQSVKSYAMVNLVWTDGATHLPLCFSLAGSPRYYTDQIVSMREEHSHPASLSYRRQEESRMTKPAIAAILLEEATKKGLQADYVLCDSWYANPSFIRLVLRKYHHHSICMLKRNKTYYEYNGHPYNLNSLYQLCSKTQSIAKAPHEQLQIEQDHDVHCIGSMVVRMRSIYYFSIQATALSFVGTQYLVYLISFYPTPLYTGFIGSN
ncbi:MAG: transposase [Syntrophaceae bacterium]